MGGVCCGGIEEAQQPAKLENLPGYYVPETIAPELLKVRLAAPPAFRCRPVGVGLSARFRLTSLAPRPSRPA